MAYQQQNRNDNASDWEIVKQAVAGNKQALRKLAERLLPQVRTTIHYLALGDSDADDLVQLAMIEILQGLGSYRAESRLETWAIKITVRTAMHHLKNRRSRLKKLMLNISLLRVDEESQEGSNPEQLSQQIQLRRQLKKLLNKLPVEQRTVIVLKLVHGYSLSEIANATESPVNTVRERLRVGRQKFRKHLAQDPTLNEWIQRRTQ